MRVPPGRAGRLALQRRLGAARQGALLLDQQLRVLLTERERIAAQRDSSAAGWAELHRDAERWLLHGVLLSGEQAVDAAAAPVTAQVTVHWRQLMGVRYPDDAQLRVDGPPADAPLPANSALVLARRRYQDALRAAVRQAALETALAVLDGRVVATRRRLRALEQGWVPRLAEALHELELVLAEQEQADNVRLRWAAARR
ncbi:V-type ATP synthase subunit D [Rhodococcus sp. X156]|uniref:V-type ATP synthase subunit D n=1 Tax=Rhodococcus sp. X156 TaxID=2499145 RepID=UPI0013E3A471|nr:V-type ATP synthase subunit D [Rhodococcus sp. X156]